MEMKRISYIIIISAILSFLISGCDLLDKLLNRPQENSVEENNIKYSIKVDKYRYNIGKEVSIDFTITNKGEQQRIFGTSGTGGCLSVIGFLIEKDGQEIFNYPQYWLAYFGQLVLEPGESKSCSFLWNQIDNEESAVEKGNYTIKAFVGQTYSGQFFVSIDFVIL
jgi:hypothetical protein